MSSSNPSKPSTVLRGKLLRNLLFLLPFVFIVTLSAWVEKAYARQHPTEVVALSDWTVIVHEDVTDGYETYHVYTVYSRLTGNHLATFATLEAAEAFVAVYSHYSQSLRITHVPPPHRTDWVSPVHH